MSRHAVVLAGGKGTRLHPYTVVLPKPLLPVGDQPILELIVRMLARHDFRNITLAVNHQADIIKAFFGDGSRCDVCIRYSLETQPLRTIAPLRHISDLPDHFVIMNGDILTDLDISTVYERHVRGDRLFTVAVTSRRTRIDYGVLDCDASGRMVRFREKPEILHDVSMGVYIASRRIINAIPAEGAYGFDDLMRELLNEKQPVHIERHDGYWLDIGRPEDYIRAVRECDSQYISMCRTPTGTGEASRLSVYDKMASSAK